MKEVKKTYQYRLVGVLSCVIGAYCLFAPPCSAKKVEFKPTLTVTEQYTDNFNRTKTNKKDEWSTTYAAGLTLSVADQKANFSLQYTPMYRDYAEFNERDTFAHNVYADGRLYTGKHTFLNFTERFVRDETRSDRNNVFREHQTNTTAAGITHTFGKKDVLGMGYTYSFDDYENANADGYVSHKPSARITYWFTPEYGFNANVHYKITDYDTSGDDLDTYSADMKLMRKFTRHLDGYVKYSHLHTERNSGDHTVYNPSVGIDWQPAKDSGISLGLGVLMNEWESGSDSEQLFAEFDAFKDFIFSKRSKLSVTGSSGYDDAGSNASSLGFKIYAQAGALYTYRITKTLTTELEGSVEYENYDQPTINRVDTESTVGAGIVWFPLKWLSVSFRYTFTDFETDSVSRQDYQENKVSLSASFIPSRPTRVSGLDSRRLLEDRFFD